eukprot:2443313-Heterocapsa_arctica.AAC.1
MFNNNRHFNNSRNQTAKSYEAEILIVQKVELTCNYTWLNNAERQQNSKLEMHRLSSRRYAFYPHPVGSNL